MHCTSYCPSCAVNSSPCPAPYPPLHSCLPLGYPKPDISAGRAYLPTLFAAHLHHPPVVIELLAYWGQLAPLHIGPGVPALLPLLSVPGTPPSVLHATVGYLAHLAVVSGTDQVLTALPSIRAVAMAQVCTRLRLVKGTHGTD